MSHAFRRLALASLVMIAAWPVRADEPLPLIATYELRRARASVRDPKGFWVGEIVGRIEDRKPLLNMSLNQPVTVAVSFVVGRDGHLVSAQVAKSSGDSAVDKQAVAVLASAAPFPPMPAGLPDDSMSFTVPLRFK